MSLPITAVGPLNVETKPILMESAAIAGFASARTVAPASQNAVFIIAPSSQFTCARAMLALCANCQGSGKHDLWCPSTSKPVSQKTMHHNSQEARIARIIVLVRELADAALCPGCPDGRPASLSDQIFGAIDDVGRVAEIADGGDLAG